MHKKSEKTDFMNQKKQPGILAIHDLSGHSHTSLMAIVPIMTVMGIPVTALPTAVLSSNTEQEGFQLVELTKHLQGFLQQWTRLKLSFDAIYSGFLGSGQQMEIVLSAIKIFGKSKTLIVVDPVMGDDGKLYSCFNQGIIQSMRKLVAKADIITPNLTEAAFLLGEKYQDNISLKTAKNWCQRLSEQGPGQVIITNVPVAGKYPRTSVICYDKHTEMFHKAVCSYLPVNYPGTGDIFTCVLTALRLKGLELFIAIDKTVRFVSRAMQLTMQQGTPAVEGICLEQAIRFLPKA